MLRATFVAELLQSDTDETQLEPRWFPGNAHAPQGAVREQRGEHYVQLREPVRALRHEDEIWVLALVEARIALAGTLNVERTTLNLQGAVECAIGGSVEERDPHTVEPSGIQWPSMEWSG